MMGRQRRDQGKLFYEFRLDDRIPTAMANKTNTANETVLSSDLIRFTISM